MKTIIDEAEGLVTVLGADGAAQSWPLASPEAFAAASRAWLRAGWDVKHVYSFTWLGRPIIQLPEDMVRVQELVFTVRPDVLIETGIAHGGSLVFYASLFEAMGHGRVIGVEHALRPPNRAALDAHPMRRRIEIVEGSSTDPGTIERVRALIAPGERAMVVLDARHSFDHVLAELRAYAPLVPVGSWVIACDGIMEQMAEAPRSQPGWATDNPKAAAERFVAEDPRFAILEPEWLFNEGAAATRVTYWPSGTIRRIA
ncbi:MAG TPA: CmcI family methyltransferase [Allosphingosinicella sp.]|nr:CmcI family methyltransferase [Allosphingosinicella sp.]